MNPAIEALFCNYLRVAGDDKPTAAILTLADVLAPMPGFWAVRREPSGGMRPRA